MENEIDQWNDYYAKDDHIHYSRGKANNIKKSEGDLIVEFIKRDMSDSQIDVSHHISAGLLYIGTSRNQLHYYEKTRATRNIYELFESILPSSFYNIERSSSSSSSPKKYRLVLDVKTELHTRDYKKLEYLLKLEELYHTIFHTLQGSSICSYPVHDLEQTLTDASEYGKLTTVRLNSHSGVIFARKFGKGLALALE